MTHATVASDARWGWGLWQRLARRPFAVLFVFCLLLWLPGALMLPPTDRDESRFAQASKQMLESGNFIDIRFGSVPRYKKPIGIYWLQAASAAVTGGPTSRIWPYRLPSLFGAFAAVMLTFWSMRAFTPPPVALAGAALLASSVLLLGEANIATTDAVLLAMITGAQGVLLRAYLSARDAQRERPTLGLALLGWAFFAGGILIKGPMVVAVCGLTVIALSLWDREWRWFARMRPLSGIALTIALVAPWMIAIALQSHGQFFAQSLGHDFGAKLDSAQETHGAPPSYYFVLATLTFFPATLFMFPAIGAAFTRRSEAAIRFLLIWALATWVMVEIVPTKLPHYVLPAYPALAMLAAVWLFTPPEQSEKGWQRALRIAALVQFAIGGMALVAAPLVLSALYGEGIQWWLVAGAVLAACFMLAAFVAARRHENLFALIAAGLGVLILYPLILAGVGPQLQPLWVSPRAAALVARYKKPGDPPLIASGYEEPSLVFLRGTNTRLGEVFADAEEIAHKPKKTSGTAAAELAGVRGGLALIEDRERNDFLKGLVHLGARAAKQGELSGLNYSRGKRAHITLYRVAPAPLK